MMKATTETFFPIDIEIKTEQLTRKEQVWLTEGQYEVLETLTKILGKTIGEYITVNILSLLECEVQDTIPYKLKEKLQGKSSYEEANPQ